MAPQWRTVTGTRGKSLLDPHRKAPPVARENFDDWVPVEYGDVAIQALNRASATESLGRPEQMTSTTKQVPRSGEFEIAGVARGGTYGETSGTNDYVQLVAQKVGGAIRIAEEDLLDPTVDVLSTKRVDAARNMAKFYDNATLGCSAAYDGTNVLYTSAYRAVRANDTNVSYTADDNFVSGAATYANLSAVLGKVEESDFFDAGDMVVIAHPAFKAVLRGIKDDNSMPIFVSSQLPGTPSTLFEYPITFSLGAKVSATNTYAPTGNPLLIIANRMLLINGLARLTPQIVTPNPGFAIQRARTGVGFLSDEALMKAAMRRAFVVGDPRGVAVFEKTS
jgi:HK97 family phage major capsid protein